MNLAGLYVADDSGAMIKLHSLLTKRELFAAMALQGILSGGDIACRINREINPNIIEFSIEIAETMIAALDSDTKSKKEE